MLPQIPFARRHVPLVTTSIEFPPERLPPHPPITTRVEFTPSSVYDSMSELRPISNFGAQMNDPCFDESARSTESNTSSVATGSTSHNVAHDADGSSSGEEEEEESQESQDEDREKIEKPKGEVTRQYKLADVLGKSGWSPEQIEKLRLYVHNKADARLDTSRAYAFQKKELVNLVCAEARVEFPELGNYSACWPVIDILKRRLKSTSERARKHSAKGKNKARA